MLYVDVAIIGGGPAGLAAALSAKEAGAASVLVIERDNRLGGILNQCIHSGFGLHRFKAELTGPEYAQIYIDLTKDSGIEFMLNTIVLDVNKDRIIKCASEDGLKLIEAKSVVFAMGCRERSRGAMNIPGFRPAGIYSAGTAQRLMNIEGLMPAKKAVIVGSGDIGLIMARRLSLEGAKVEACVEIMPYSGGLKRNIVQCLDDFGIPLLLSHTITKIYGKKRVEGIDIAKVDDQMNVIPDTERHIDCDTLLFSVGLIPENELSRNLGLNIDPRTKGPFVDEKLMTEVPGIFACGNVLHVHDLADNVSIEAEKAGNAAANFAMQPVHSTWTQADLVLPTKEKNYGNKGGAKETTCIRCPKGCTLHLEFPESGANYDNIVVTGNTCPKGEEYGKNEIICPMRTVCSSVLLDNSNIAMLPVRTNGDIPKAKIVEVMKEIHSIHVNAPIKAGEVIINNVANTGIDIIATRDMSSDI